MKQLAVVMILIIIFITLSIYTQKYLDASSTELIKKIDSIYEHVKSNDWEKAVKSSREFEELWDKNENAWDKITEHQEIDLIQTSISKINAHAQFKETSKIFVEMSSLKLLLKHIPHKYEFTINNIL